MTNRKCLGRNVPDTFDAKSAHLTGLKMRRITRAVSFDPPPIPPAIWSGWSPVSSGMLPIADAKKPRVGGAEFGRNRRKVSTAYAIPLTRAEDNAAVALAM